LLYSAAVPLWFDPPEGWLLEEEGEYGALWRGGNFILGKIGGGEKFGGLLCFPSRGGLEW